MDPDTPPATPTREELVAQLTGLLDTLHTPEEADRQLAAVVDALRRTAAAVPERAAQLEAVVAGSSLLFDPVPRAAIAQARRRAERRRRLLATGAYDIDALAELRGSSTTAASTWLARMRDAHRLISVTGPGGRVWVPGLLLDTTSDPAGPLSGTADVLGPLLEAGMGSWAIWVWLTTRSSWLDGEVPGELLATMPARAADGARRFAAQRAATDQQAVA